MRCRVWLIGMLGTVIAMLAMVGSGSASQPALRLSVVPRAGLVDRARAITISGLAPGAHVTLDAQTSYLGAVSGSKNTYTADRQGRVDLATAAPVSGSYHQPSAMGPFWSASFEHRGAPADGTGNVSVTRLTATTGDGQASSVTVTQFFLAPGVITEFETVGGGEGFVGSYFIPAHRLRDGPAMVVWGGSEGGEADFSIAGLLASHGIPTLDLAYFDEPGLPCSLANIPIEYFVKAIRWLRQQPGIDPRRVWAWGTSRGSEALGLVASHFPNLLHGIIDDSASSLVYNSIRGNCAPTSPVAWTLGGRPVSRVTGHFPVAATTTGPAMIPFGQYHGAVLLVSGSDDGLWPSNGYEHTIMRELHADPAAHVHLNYPNAGHSNLGPPNMPVFLTSNDHGHLVHFGGTVAGTENAYEHSWPAMLRFITTH